MYGDAIRRFNSVEGVAMQFVECAMTDSDLFEELKLLKTVTAEDVYKRIDLFDSENSVLSVITPKNRGN